MNILEDIEWTQYWAENNSRSLPRILLIGDSISVGYRRPVYERISDSLCAVTVSTSKALDNSSFFGEIKFIAREEGFDYSAVHFNNGLHGFHLSTAEYAELYEKAVRLLIEEFPDAAKVLATSTPYTSGGDNLSFDEKNDIVKARNEVVFSVAEKYGLTVDDLYSVTVGNPGIKCGDGVHFHDEGYEILADSVVSSVFSAMNGLVCR